MLPSAKLRSRKNGNASSKIPVPLRLSGPVRWPRNLVNLRNAKFAPCMFLKQPIYGCGCETHGYKRSAKHLGHSACLQDKLIRVPERPSWHRGPSTGVELQGGNMTCPSKRVDDADIPGLPPRP